MVFLIEIGSSNRLRLRRIPRTVIVINKTIRHSYDREGLTFSSKRLVGSKTRLLRETPCKFIEDERSLVAAISRGKCVEDELPIRQSPVSQKVPLRGTYSIQYRDQAATVFDGLAWSFSLKSVLRTACVFGALLGSPIIMGSRP